MSTESRADPIGWKKRVDALLGLLLARSSKRSLTQTASNAGGIAVPFTAAGATLASVPITVAAGQKVQVWAGDTAVIQAGGIATDKAALLLNVDGSLASGFVGSSVAGFAAASGANIPMTLLGELSGLSAGAHTLTLIGSMLNGTDGHYAGTQGFLMASVVSF